jgi:signal transduction histidine kinase
MVCKMISAGAVGAILALSPAAFAQQTARLVEGFEARSMLRSVIDEVKVNREQAFDMFNKGNGRFHNGDTYVFCNNTGNGKFVAMGNQNAKELLGQDVRTLKDATGKAFGQEIYDAGQKPAGEITEVSYLFAKPSDPKPAAKKSFITKVDDDFACGVGYYE